MSLASPPSAHALDRNKAVTQYTLEFWKTEQGLPVNTISSLTQSRDGYLWLGTQSGLVRFDGIECRTFNRRNTPQFKTSIVTAVLGTSDGALWVGLQEGGLVVGNQGRFVPALTEQLADSTVTALSEDGTGGVWIGTESGGLYRRMGAKVETASGTGGLGGPIRQILNGGDGTTWAAVEETGVWRIGPDGQAARLGVSDDLPSDLVISIERGGDGSLWIGTHGGGLARLAGDRIRVLTTADGLPSEIVRSVVEDSHGNLWAATQGGLSRVSVDHDSVATVDTRRDLGTNDVQCVLEDREGSLWIGTRGGGLCRLKDSPITAYGFRDGLSVDQVWTVLEDSHGDLWFGTAGGLFRRRNGSIQLLLSVKNGLSHDTVLSLCEGRDGSLWVGTRHGLNHIHDGVITSYFAGQDLPDDFIRALVRDRDGRVWIGSRAGVTVFEDGQFFRPWFADAIDDEVVRYIHHARDGSVWIATNGNGLVHIHDGLVERLGSEAGLSSGFVYAVHEDHEGTLWVGTNEGLNRIRDGRAMVLTKDDGLPDDFIYRILADSGGNLWLSTTIGVVRASLVELNRALDSDRPVVGARAFGTSHGMLSQDCNGGVQPAGWKDHEGHLWFPTSRGVVEVRPTEIYRNEVPPRVVVERVTASPGGDQEIADGSIVLQPGTARFELHYAALSLMDPSRVRYRYRLGGFEDEWTEAGARRTAYYTNVPPGRYVFRVAGCNNDGVWSTTDATIGIELRPKLYQTKWMAVLIFLAGGGLVMAAVKLRTRHFRQRQQELVTLVEERTTLLQNANRQLEVLANHDGLTGIANRRHFAERFDREWMRARRAGDWISVILADIDQFKAFNDTYGHQAGDDCLRRVAQALERCVHRPADLVARYGGEEFVVLLPDTDPDGALAVSEVMRRAVLDLRIFDAEEGPGRNDEVVSLSFGVAGIRPQLEDQGNHLLEAADGALYQAKEQGRNRSVSANNTPTGSGITT
jgi:diguanylate cyclase (GGDEF)-like protein